MSLSIEASVLLTGTETSAIGRERIRLLEAVARHGSITAGAKAVGLSYKAAWDGLDAMANLFGQPLLETRTGGKAGGGARLTATGIRVVEAWHKLEAGLARVLGEIEPDLAGTGIRPLQLMSGFLMRTSARNTLRGTISRIVSDKLMAEVQVVTPSDIAIYAQITNESVRELGLVPGRNAIVLVKASFIIIAPGHSLPAISVRNCIAGTVLRAETTSVSAEVVVDIGGGGTLAATLTAQSARDLELAPGKPVHALFDAAHVIVATD